MTQNSEDRREALLAELDRALRILREQYLPLKIYLYGSLAHGTVSEWSDLDLVIVKDTTKRFLDRTAEVLGLVMPRVGMDIAVYTPIEWEQLLRERPFIRDEVVGRGNLLYAA